ncbi:MAG: AAA-like domain-containing protein [Pegethrix bostrychoides GSE-TBD4-15B]|uniref:AAA-like domain-containing protein n=1 Tax=Pegethrix bostrychoides GSE-TBD4-15B TaxID=2839662 RepID=A0A951U474_9CYAN|nr:AAA-like domain-containing protein [Pegethrix bostrychoides GSE-TBD4-15B]
MTPDEALLILESLLQPKSLNDLQQTVFCQSWAGQNYEEIAAGLSYDASYIRDIGSQLWLMLSKALGEKVTKKNMHVVFRRYQQEQMRQSLGSYGRDRAVVHASDRLEFPNGVVALGSPFYIERPPIELRAFSEVCKPGSLIRIRAPRQMGKSSLMHRILAHAKQHGLQTATLNLQRADRAVFSSLDAFLRWLCANIAQQLGLAPALADYWNSEIGSKMSCTIYFQRYLLPTVEALVLAFDEVNRLFEYPDLAADFLPLLRSWYEDASEYEVWQRLRLVVVHATEVYIPLNLNQSPFNVGLPITLPELTLVQVQALALRHGLHWATGEAGASKLTSLLEMIGGHPYLVRLALYHLARQEMTLEQLLQAAPTSTGIYSEHLRQQLSHLQNQPQLAAAFWRILSSKGHLEPIELYKLESLGLVKIQTGEIQPSCYLYQRYFQDQLGKEETA